MNNPLISIIIPTYNRAHIICDTLESVLAQTYTNWECIVVDDGSTDDTAKVVKLYLSKDSRFNYFERPADYLPGGNGARNYGFKLSKGEYINWFDSDDLMDKKFLETKVKVLESDLNLDFCACLGRSFHKKLEKLGKIDRPLKLSSQNYLEDYILNRLYFYTPSPMWRRSFLENKMLFDEKLVRGQEKDFHFRMLLSSPNFKYLDKDLFFLRKGKESISDKANSSISSQESVFYYFHMVYCSLNTRKTNLNKTKLNSFIFYRQSLNYYKLCCLSKNFILRFQVFRKYFKSLIIYMINTNSLTKHSLRMFVGAMTLLFFNKGFRLIYFPRYNYGENNE
jgi:glycosyltransferase involved in cell wall biosynthesis